MLVNGGCLYENMIFTRNQTDKIRLFFLFLQLHLFVPVFLTSIFLVSAQAFIAVQLF